MPRFERAPSPDARTRRPIRVLTATGVKQRTAQAADLRWVTLPDHEAHRLIDAGPVRQRDEAGPRGEQPARRKVPVQDDVAVGSRGHAGLGSQIGEGARALRVEEDMGLAAFCRSNATSREAPA
jgi:hypothetical protein